MLLTAWNGSLPSGAASVNTSARTDSLVFKITSAAGKPTLKAVKYFVPTSATLTGSSYTAHVWTTTSGTASASSVTSNAGAGTFTANAWNRIALTSPVVLSVGTWYSAAISHPDYLEYLHNYWGSGEPGASGFQIGPVNIPSAASAPGGVQQGFVAAANTFPGGVTSPGSWYGVDFEIDWEPFSGLLAASVIL